MVSRTVRVRATSLLTARAADIPSNYQEPEPLARFPSNGQAPQGRVEATVLDVATFASLAKAMSAAQFGDFVSRVLLSIDIKLIEIASRRAEKDFSGVAYAANKVAFLAGKLGAVRAQSIALRLEMNCNAEADDTYPLLGVLATAVATARDCMFSRILSDEMKHASQPERCDAICPNT